MRLPKPKHSLGYSQAELAALLGAALPSFLEWMRDQTIAMTEDGLALYYQQDVQRFIGGPTFATWD